MDLSRSTDDFLHLVNSNPQIDLTATTVDDQSSKDEILPNYDFQPIRPSAVAFRSSDDSPPMGGGGDSAVKAWNSADARLNSSPTRVISSIIFLVLDNFALIVGLQFGLLFTT